MTQEAQINRTQAFDFAKVLRKNGHGKEADILCNAGGNMMRTHLFNVFQSLVSTEEAVEVLSQKPEVHQVKQENSKVYGPLTELQCQFIGVYQTFSGKMRNDFLEFLGFTSVEKQQLADMGYIRIATDGRSRLSPLGKNFRKD